MKPRLLIADSDADLCHVFQRFLTGQGYDVETVSDGLSCLEKVRRTSPDVLLLDRGLYWGGGDGVLAWLREEWAMSRPAVVLTATAGSLPDVPADTRPPVVRFLPKPFLLRDLLESLQTAVARRGQEEAFNSNRSAVWSELYLG
jgi:DNA-binding response OmpR family regulator